MIDISLRNKTCVIAVHEAIPIGPTHELRKFLLENQIGELLFIAHPLIYIKEFYKSSSRYELYRQGKLLTKKKGLHWILPEPFLYIKDFLYTCWWTFSQNKKYTFFIGVDPLNALAGLFLRSIGKTDKVVYYSIDYFTTRFENKLLNAIYHSIDKICVKYSDETWNLSSNMALARQSYNGMNIKVYKKQFVVPVGVWFYEAKRKTYEQIKKNKLVFIGSLVPMMGVDLILRAMPKIIKKFPSISLDIIGGGPEDKKLHALARDLGLIKNIRFYGWMSDRKQLQKLMADGAIGLAPFNTIILDDQVKNADPAKLKDYMLWGMPIIISNAVSNAKKLEKIGCAYLIDYKEEDLVNAVVFLLRNESRLKRYRANALAYIEQFDYNSIFKKNLARLFTS